jgi:hypothetical protein
MLEWRTRYALKSFLRSSMLLAPLAAYVVSLVAIRILGWMDARLQKQWAWQLSVDVVQTVLQMFIAAMLSLFTFSSLLVAIQIVSAQLTPRIIATTLLRDHTIRLTAALFVLSFVFDLGLLARTQTEVLYVPLTVSLILTVGSIGAFLYLMDYAARLLRPSVFVHWTSRGWGELAQLAPPKGVWVAYQEGRKACTGEFSSSPRRVSCRPRPTLNRRSSANGWARSRASARPACSSRPSGPTARSRGGWNSTCNPTSRRSPTIPIPERTPTAA